MPPLLRLAGITKRYGAVEALAGVDLDVDTGEVVAICGDNGAGKSTLIRVASGAHEPDAGRIEIEGEAVSFRSPLDALGAGVATIYQDLALAPRLPVWQNVFVGAELSRTLAPGVRVLDKRAMRQRAGTTVILISHNMAEVVAVASRVAVLKSGRKIADRPVEGLTADDLAHLVMIGQLPPRAA